MDLDSVLFERVWLFILIGAYLTMMLAISIYTYSRRTKEERSDPKHHFMGNSQYGSLFLALTDFSATWSTFTLLGVPNEAAKLGWIALRLLPGRSIGNLFEGSVIPRIRRLSIERNYTASNDFTTDRFNNRILSVVSTLCMAIPSLLRVTLQFYGLKKMIPVVTAGAMDEETTVWVVAIVIVCCESLGGLTSVSITDCVQSIVMLVSFLVLPWIAVNQFGWVGESMKAGCPNEHIVNCATESLRDAVCYGQNVTVGCIGSSSNPWKILSPPTGWSEWNWNGTDYTQIGAPDTVKNLNFTPWKMVATAIFLNIGFFSPGKIQRMISARTDDSLKKSIIAANVLELFALLPMIMTGLLIGANMMELLPKGIDPQSAFVSSLIDQGGGKQVVGIVATIAIFAALMSTCDSVVCGLTNVISRDILQNGLLRGIDLSPSTLRRLNVAITCIMTFTAASIALYARSLEEDVSIYINLSISQGAIKAQVVPLYLIGLYTDRRSEWPIIGGIIVGLSLMCGLNLWSTSIERFGTPFSDSTTKTLVVSSGFISLAGNLLVTACLYCVPSWPPTPDILKVDPNKKSLTFDEIQTLAPNDGSPFRRLTGKLIFGFIVVFAFFTLPLFNQPYDGCNAASYDAWVSGKPSGDCNGGSWAGGIPTWAMLILLSYGVNTLLSNLYIYMWDTSHDKEPLKLSEMIRFTSKSNAKTTPLTTTNV
jgi:Na+/proline symporter